MKTNDVTGRYRRGEYGMALEFGRPGVGTRIAEIEKVLVDTVVSWGLATRIDADASLPVRAQLSDLGIPVRPNVKINLGLGQPLVEE